MARKKHFKPKDDLKYKFDTGKYIRAHTVRLVGDNVEGGIFSIDEALKLADEMGLTLVEISPGAKPPVCKIVDFQKFIFEQKKRKKEMKSKQQKVVVKEIRFGPNIDEHDFNFKLNYARKFLEAGSKVKVFVFFKGRTIVYKDHGKIKLLEFAKELEDYAKVEKMPELEGKKMTMFLAPIKKKK
ncbi:MAG: translation initiation factor IF-3 [Bacteroidia bacterium]|nr:MAG: translation initiation factor IF-3 [Bacteroidia bacterium]